MKNNKLFLAIKTTLSLWLLCIVTILFTGCFGKIGGLEILVILILILLLFGAKKIPELARGLGRGLREFKKAVKEVEDIEPDGESASKTESSTTQSTSESEKERS